MEHWQKQAKEALGFLALFAFVGFMLGVFRFTVRDIVQAVTGLALGVYGIFYLIVDSPKQTFWTVLLLLAPSTILFVIFTSVKWAAKKWQGTSSQR